MGDQCWVSGTVDPSGDHPGDAAGQARAAWAIVLAALEEAGFEPAHVVRTRMYVTDAAYAVPVAEVHGEIFGEIRPATSLLVIRALISPELLVEVEAEALRPR